MSIEDLLASRSLRAGDEHHRAYVGPPHQYDFMGATQFRLLTTLGLREEHSVLDIGCGSLRAGRLLIAYLLPGRYFGLEPNKWLIDNVIEQELGADTVALKAPKFAHNNDFDYGVFGERFDYVVAQSIFSHSGRDLTVRALEKLHPVMKPDSNALVTFALADHHGERDTGEGWVYPGVVTYHQATVEAMISEAQLHGQRLPWFHPRQTWFLLTQNRKNLLSQAQLAVLGGAVLRDPRFNPG